MSEPSRPPRAEAVATDETVKETIESIVIAFILAFVFRAFIVEPFIIPTGSMAPTMLGAHFHATCPSCGYTFDVGVDPTDTNEISGMFTVDGKLRDTIQIGCPMCNYPVTAELGTAAKSGDRILVDKFSYHFTDPKRWDVVVFKAPKDQVLGGEPAPRTNFIKRLVGLPGERVAILDGNIFVASEGTNEFKIARKTDPQENHHWERIQRAIWQPIYHSQYVPIESGLAEGPGRDAWSRYRVPWVTQSGEWDLGSARRPKRSYTFKGGSGEISFEMIGDDGTLFYNEENARFPYNQLTSSLSTADPIEDIRLACSVTPGAGSMQLRLSTTARLDRPGNGIETLEARISETGDLSLHAVATSGASRQLGTPARTGRLRPGIATEIELWLVDDEASIWINGEQTLVYRFDLSWEQIAKRKEPSPYPEIRIGIDSDEPVELRRVELDRDLYYFAERYPTPSFARGEAARINGLLSVGPTPLDLRQKSADHDAEMFVLGDNQPASEDGRGWSSVDGWVQERYFDGDQRVGVVPRSLLVGRAFMVYYPAPHGLTPQDKGVFPNFGRMRFVH